MDFKRIFRTPFIWVAVILAVGLLAISLSGGDGFQRIDTSAAQKLITTKAVDSAKFVGDDQIQLTLKPGQSYSDGDKVKNASKVMAYYVVQRGPSLVKSLTDNQPPKGYTETRHSRTGSTACWPRSSP